MRLAPTVPMTKPEGGYGGGTFSSAREAYVSFRKRTAGELLVVTDGERFPFLSFANQCGKTISMVLDGADALPLFSAPDGVGGVLAAGDRATVLAARAFSTLNRLPCALLPSDGSMDGVYDRASEVPIGGELVSLPLAHAEVFWDKAILSSSLPTAYARLLLSRLAVFEQRAKEVLGLSEPIDLDPLFSALSVLEGEPSAEEIIEANAEVRLAEIKGAPRGEGVVLSASYPKKSDPIRAFCELFALYSAFFKRGKPRKFLVPDYATRARRAGTVPSVPPDGEAFACLCIALEKRRVDLVRMLDPIGREKERRLFFEGKLSGRRFLPQRDLSALSLLPERSGGLSCIIRDFGLMEWS